jgi:hypothetical protein
MAQSKYKQYFPLLVEMYLQKGFTTVQAVAKLGVSVQKFLLF